MKWQIQKVIADVVWTRMEYDHGQLVSVRDCMADAKAAEGESRMQVLQDVSCFFFVFFMEGGSWADAVLGVVVYEEGGGWEGWCWHGHGHG